MTADRQNFRLPVSEQTRGKKMSEVIVVVILGMIMLLPFVLGDMVPVAL